MNPTDALVALARRGDFAGLQESVAATRGDDTAKTYLLYTLVRVAGDYGHAPAADEGWNVEAEALRHDDHGVGPALVGLDLAKMYLRGDFGLDNPSLAKPHLVALTAFRGEDVPDSFAEYLAVELADVRASLSGKGAAIYDSVPGLPTAAKAKAKSAPTADATPAKKKAAAKTTEAPKKAAAKKATAKKAAPKKTTAKKAAPKKATAKKAAPKKSAPKKTAAKGKASARR